MRLFGHPVHVMFVHFPVALWPVHWVLRLFWRALPQPGAGFVAFWLLAAGCALGFLAALCGAADLVGLRNRGEIDRLRAAFRHLLINGTVLVGFTALALAEYTTYPLVRTRPASLAVEALLLALMVVGNFFGGAAAGYGTPHAAATPTSTP